MAAYATSCTHNTRESVLDSISAIEAQASMCIYRRPFTTCTIRTTRYVATGDVVFHCYTNHKNAYTYAQYYYTSESMLLTYILYVIDDKNAKEVATSLK